MPDLTPAEQRTADEREQFVDTLGPALTDTLEVLGIEDADWNDGRSLADTVYCLGYRHAPAADHTATLDHIRALVDWHGTKAEKARRFPGEGREAEMAKAAEVHDDAARRLRAALDGDTDQCGDPTCDDEHGGGA